MGLMDRQRQMEMTAMSTEAQTADTQRAQGIFSRRTALLASTTVLAGSMLATFGVTGVDQAHATGGVFRDVSASTEHGSSIEWAAEHGITTGYADGTFRPRAPIERQAVAAFLFRMAGDPGYQAAPGVPLFVDVSSGSLFGREISWLKGHTVTFGWADGTFRPDSAVDRQTMAAFLYRLFGGPLRRAGLDPDVAGVSPFVDVPASSQFAVEVAWLRAVGVTTGWSDGTFRPMAPVTRDAAAAFCHRMDWLLRDRGY